MNELSLNLRTILSKFQQEYEIGHLSIFSLKSNEQLFCSKSAKEASPLKNLPELIRSSVTICEKLRLDAINIEGKNSTFIKSLGNNEYLILSMPSSSLNVGETKFFLSNFGLNYIKQELAD